MSKLTMLSCALVVLLTGRTTAQSPYDELNTLIDATTDLSERIDVDGLSLLDANNRRTILGRLDATQRRLDTWDAQIQKVGLAPEQARPQPFPDDYVRRYREELRTHTRGILRDFTFIRGVLRQSQPQGGALQQARDLIANVNRRLNAEVVNTMRNLKASIKNVHDKAKQEFQRELGEDDRQLDQFERIARTITDLEKQRDRYTEELERMNQQIKDTMVKLIDERSMTPREREAHHTMLDRIHQKFDQLYDKNMEINERQRKAFEEEWKLFDSIMKFTADVPVKWQRFVLWQAELGR
ncbi:MAG: hypothetical protein H6834_15525 [Planctomycetes bacterium]|nr:hypothetical protein [Planctomycetota bacterium]